MPLIGGETAMAASTATTIITTINSKSVKPAQRR